MPIADPTSLLSALTAFHARLERGDWLRDGEMPELADVLRTVRPDVQRAMVTSHGDRERERDRVTRTVVVAGAPLFDIVVETATAGPWDDRALMMLDVVEGLLGRAIDSSGSARLEMSALATSVLQHLNDAVIARSWDGAIRYLNPRAESLYGISLTSAVGQDLDTILETQYPPGMARDSINSILEETGFWEGELVHRGRDGARLRVRSRKAIIQGSGSSERLVVTVNSDETARRESEIALERSEELFRSQFLHSAIGQATRLPDGRLEAVNPALAEMFGYADVPSALADLGNRSPYDIPVAREAYDNLTSGRSRTYSAEIEVADAHGDPIPVDYRVSVVRDAEGQVVRFVSHFLDLRSIKRAEKERDRAEAELRERLADLDAMNRLKTDLFGMLGHELKNPLAVLQMAAEVAGMTWASEPSGPEREFLAMTQRNLSRMQATITEILTLVVSDAGQLTARPRALALAPVLAKVQATMGSDVPVGEAEIGLQAMVQEEHLIHMMSNLLGNAQKYAGGAESIHIDQIGDYTAIDVRDSGPGIPDDFQDLLFDRFARAEETASEIDGTGLGLYVVRQLARANGGDAVYLPGEAGGSIFRILLPGVDAMGVS